MELQSLTAGLLALSVLASLVLTILATENPASIPFRTVFAGAVPGLALFVFFWWVVCFAVEEILRSLFPEIVREPTLQASLALFIGLVVPQMARLKNLILTPRTARYLGFLQLVDEQTGLYFGRVIRREERKINIAFFQVDGDRRRRALDRLFEYHNTEIACEDAQRGRSPEAVLAIFKTRQQDVKFKQLLRFLGYTQCLKDLQRIAAAPHILFPTWPAELGDRRKGSALSEPRAETIVAKRRKYEAPEVQAYVLDFVTIPPLKKKYQVFVSSTFLDLREERQQVLRSLLRCDCIPAGMELFPSSDEDLWTLIKGIVDDCDYYVLLVGNRYGSLTSRGISYTDTEYEYARSCGKPILPFFHATPSALPESEGPDQTARLAAFKEKVGRNHAPAYWSRADEIPALLQQAIEKVKLKQPGRGWVRHERSLT